MVAKFKFKTHLQNIFFVLTSKFSKIANMIKCFSNMDIKNAPSNFEFMIPISNFAKKFFLLILALFC